MSDGLFQLVVEIAARYRQALPSASVFPRVTVEELRAALGGPLPHEGCEAEQVIREFAAGAEAGIVASTGPRYFGFVIGGNMPVTTAADWLCSVWDQNAWGFASSPAASVAEEIAAQWLLELLALPRTASVGFVTGGGTANFTALAAARHGVLRWAGWDVEQNGLQGAAPQVHVVVSEESHATILSAVRLIGLGAKLVKPVPADGQGRMIAAELPRVLKTCEGPTIVCAQVGNVNTGSFDPLPEIVDATKQHGAWLHVDGAFGMWAAASERLRHLVGGSDRADSWAVDGHKWLNVPYDCGFVICAHPEDHKGAMGISASYLTQSAPGGPRDNFDWTPEFSRRARGFVVYAAIKYLGQRGVAELIERCCARAAQFTKLLRSHKGIEILNDVVLNQVLVRFGGAGAVTRAVLDRVQRGGVCWMGGTTWHGLAAMRISVSNWSTSERDVEMSAEAVLQAAELR